MGFDTPTAVLAEYGVHLEEKVLTPVLIQAVKRHLIDTVGCAWGGSGARPSRISRSLAAKSYEQNGASVFGLLNKTSPEYAAFANTVMVRYLDFNDTGIGGHPSDMIPALLALAEQHQVSGKRFLLAIHGAYEIVRALRQGGFHRLRQKHVDQIQTVLGGAVGAGIVLGLDVTQMSNAISLALTPNIPLRVARTGELSDWKGCATAHCSMMAVFASRLAQLGLTGPKKPFAGIAGLYDLLGIEPLNLKGVGQQHENRYAVEATCLKAYPAEYSSQGPLRLIIKLRGQIDLTQLDSIEVQMHWGGWHEIGGGQGDGQEKWAPKTRESADHSLPFLLAVALLDGHLTVDSFSQERLADRQVNELMQKIRVIDSPALTREHAGELPKWPSIVTVVHKTGPTIREHSGVPLGHPLNPLSDAQVEAKFLSLCDRVLPHDRSRLLLNALKSIEAAEDLNELTGLFRFVPDSFQTASPNRDS